MKHRTNVRPEDLQSYSVLHEKCLKAGTRLVLPASMKPNTLMAVGEALGADEEIQGEYFCGKTGKILHKLFADIGLPAQSVHISNVVKVRPPDNKLANLAQINLKIEDFLDYLMEEIDVVNPVAILAVGGTALEYLTGMTGITKWRGSVLDCKLSNEKILVVPTLHPSYLVRGQMHMYPYVRHDIKYFANIGYKIKKPDVSFEQIIDPSLTECLDFLEDLYQNRTESAIDIETIGQQKITCVGFSRSPKSAICIPFRHHGLKNRWTEHEQIILLEQMKKIWQSPKIAKILQNAHYDIHFLLRLLGFPSHPLFDTMHMHNLIHADAPHDLGFLVSNYTDMPYHKDDFQDWKVNKAPHDRTLWEYNIRDVIGTHRVYHGLTKDLKDYGLYNFYVGYWAPFRRAIFEMEWRGMRVDMDLLNEWHDFIENEELPVALDILKKMTGVEINPNSSKQIGEYIELNLGISVPRTPQGNYTVNEENLKKLISSHPQHKQILRQILCCRTLKAKDLGTYLQPDKVSPDGRLRTSYGMTVTGRLSSRANHKGEGDNQQNRPKPLRQIVIPDEGHVFLAPDLSQAEALCMVYFMGADKLKHRMNAGEKIHNVVAGWVFGEKFTPEQYKLAKITVHGCVDDKTEILTLEGWKKIDEADDQEIIAQWNGQIRSITFERIQRMNSYGYSGDMIHLSQGFYDQFVTPEHRIPHWQTYYGRARIPIDGPTKDIFAKDFTRTRNSYKLPLSGKFLNTNVLDISDLETSLLVAAQADLTIRYSGEIEGNFTKGYKIARLRFLLDSLNIKYTTYPYKQTGASFYIPKCETTDKISSLLGPNKEFSKWVFQLPYSCLETLIDELTFWDGRLNGPDSGQYYTTNPKNAEWVQIVAHLTNRRCIVSDRDNSAGFGGTQNAKRLYTCSISKRPNGDLTETKIEKHKFKGKVYCPTTRTGYFLIRRNGCVSITGNSNYKMGVLTFAKNLGVPVAQAKELREKYYSVLPQLPVYHKGIDDEITTNRVLYNPYGRRRVFTGNIDAATLYSGYAFKPQSTVADTIDIGILGLWLIKPPDIYLLTQTHDEVLISGRKERLEEFKPFIVAHLETLREIPIGDDLMTIKVDLGQYKENWYGK